MDLVKELFKSIYGLGTKKFWRWWTIFIVFAAVVDFYSSVIQTYVHMANDSSTGYAIFDTIFSLIFWAVTVIAFITIPAAIVIVYEFLDVKGIPNIARKLRTMVGVSRARDRKIAEDSIETHIVFGEERDGRMSWAPEQVQTRNPGFLTFILFLLAMGISALELTIYVYIGWIIVLIYAVIFTMKRSKQV